MLILRPFAEERATYNDIQDLVSLRIGRSRRPPTPMS